MDNKKPYVITLQHLNDLSNLSNLPIILFNDQEILYANDLFKHCIDDLTFDGSNQQVKYDTYKLNTTERSEISITNNNGKVFWFDCTVSEVLYQNKPVVLSFLFDASERKQYQNRMSRIEKLRELIIEISQSILYSSELNDFFDFVLTKTLEASDKAKLGTILVLKGNHLNAVASYGYSEDIYSFKLPLEESFYYVDTNGALDKIINVKDTTDLPHYKPIKTEFGEKIYIKSSLSAPIRVKGEFYGAINLDAINKNAFDDEDIQALDFIRHAFEISITNRLTYEEKAYLSYFDPLTSLHNRYFFEENSELVIRRAKRYKEVFHLVMVDIDGLKEVNDNFGHLQGDLLIQKTAHTIQDSIRESDFFARYGGDEFVGIIYSTTSKEVVEKLTEIKNILNTSPLEYKQTKIAASISYGIASYPEDGETINELIQVADTKMYQQKKSKKRE